MMACRYQPAPCYPLDYEPRENLPAHVICHPHYRHNGQNDSQSENVYGDEENEQRYENRQCQRFNRVEAHRRPGGGWPARMVHGMGNPKNPWTVHPAMRPVKPCILR